ncbi:MAG: hypothetical protein PVI07_02635 [Anaerolineae bacterium]
MLVDGGTWDGPNNFAVRTSGDGAPTPQTGSPLTDPTTGITGIKFDEPIQDGVTRYCYSTVDGNYAEGQITVATKAGQGFDTALITGID